MSTSELIEEFAHVAREQVSHRGENSSIDELFDEWRIQHPPTDDWPQLKASHCGRYAQGQK